MFLQMSRGSCMWKRSKCIQYLRILIERFYILLLLHIVLVGILYTGCRGQGGNLQGHWVCQGWGPTGPFHTRAIVARHESRPSQGKLRHNWLDSLNGLHSHCPSRLAFPLKYPHQGHSHPLICPSSCGSPGTLSFIRCPRVFPLPRGMPPSCRYNRSNKAAPSIGDGAQDVCLAWVARQGERSWGDSFSSRAVQLGAAASRGM